MAAVAAREQAAERAKEIEETRVASWARWHAAPERIMVLAQAQFAPSYITEHTPSDGSCPEDDSEAQHEYYNAPLLGADAVDQGEVPTLVAAARAKSIPV